MENLCISTVVSILKKLGPISPHELQIKLQNYVPINIAKTIASRYKTIL